MNRKKERREEEGCKRKTIRKGKGKLEKEKKGRRTTCRRKEGRRRNKRKGK